MVTIPDLLGQLLAERYRVERELGQGGMATVYLVYDCELDRRVALKAMQAELVTALGHERFLREIGIAAALMHPNIVPLLDSGAAAGTLYFTMPYLDAGSLRARLDRDRELPIAESVRIVVDILEALRHAHAAGIVHRDIKPENILFAAGRAQVADFGIAKAIALGATLRLTQTGMAIGTPAYMAPEQAAADPQVDHRADLYALGVLWYEMLAGRPLFAGLSPQQQIAAHIARAPEPPHAVRPAVPRAVSDLVLRCLEKRPSDRWQTAAALLHAIAEVDAGNATQGGGGDHPEPTLHAYRISEALSARISRDAFDPRIVGDAIRYLDNGKISDTLVCFLTRWGIDPEDGADFLRQTPYRAIAPALFGFDADRRYRVSIPIADHLVLLSGLLRDLAESTGARHVILIGFSSGADLAIQLAAMDPGAHSAPIDGVVALGVNLATETAFLSAEVARVDMGRDHALLQFLQQMTAGMETLEQWLNVNEYLVRLVRRFRSDAQVLQGFARGIAEPFAAAPLTPFVRWYRDVTRHGRRLRCVFEDNALYRAFVRDLQVAQRDVGLLGAGYQTESLVIEAGTGHFDLEEPALIARHLDAMVQSLRLPSRPEDREIRSDP